MGDGPDPSPSQGRPPVRVTRTWNQRLDGRCEPRVPVVYMGLFF
jgi:hypothetical protein